MSKAENIKKMFVNLTPDRKEDVKYLLHKEFGVSTDTIKNSWFYDARIPDVKIDRVLQVMKEAMAGQIREAQELMDVI